ncbi:MAG TPA: hypothetical protein VG326_06935 [Tepidisphaeraceae bacterium]|jgi:O-antigen ligase|nr:hypothetical protein [Tepidisphaeraceae bacterium]
MQYVASPPQSRAQLNVVYTSPWRRLTQIAFILSLALTAARMLMDESIRTLTDPLAGGVAPPNSPGPAAGLVLDLLFCIPTLLVLGRRAFDDHYSLLFSWTYVPMGLLAALAALSPLWAADKFASVVSASHLVCGLVFLWSTSQLMRSWLGLKLTAGACIGILLALSLAGYYYRVVEVADLKQMWARHKTEILAERGWPEGTYEARMFENRVLKGQPMGFSDSTNTYAALLVLLGVVSAGVAIQRAADRDHWGWIIVPATASAGALPLIAWTGCRAAYVTPAIAVLILGAVWLLRERLARFATAGYAIGVACAAAAVAVVVQHGRDSQTLWQDSLTFRWRYWLGSYRLLTSGLRHAPRDYSHLFFGVGWENFGPFYLAHRLAVASEEIRDPHNFIVRTFVELGLVGGVLLLIWMLRLAWELTRRPVPFDVGGAKIDPRNRGAFSPTRPSRTTAMLAVAIIASTTIAINVACSVDFAADGWYAFLELARRTIFFCVMLIGLSVAALESPAGPKASGDADQVDFKLDNRPAPWVLYAVLAALATFLIHNLIEFSLFEPGPWFLFALLTGGALGLRSEGRRRTFPADDSACLFRRPAATVATAVAGAGWLAAAILLATPVAAAESLARDADADAYRAAAIRPRDPAYAQQLIVRAAAVMTDAWRRLSWNADYASRAARMLIASGGSRGDSRQIKKLLDAAVAADPSSVGNLTLRARFELAELAAPDAARRDFESALALDPNNVRLRLDFARELKAMSVSRPKLVQSALLEYDRALDMNNLLEPAEIKRLTPTELARAQAEIADLERHAAAASQ